MAHEIYMQGDKAAMAFSGTAPWHGLGQSMPENASFADWIAASGFDYEILSAPTDYAFHGELRTFPGRNILCRSDNGTPLSIVSDRYKVVQPAQVMQFFKEVCGEFGYVLETAGVLGQGQKYWALVRTGKSCEPIKEDKINSYIMLATSCDRTLPTIAKETSVRVVCQNTLSRSLKNSDGKEIRVKHSSEFNPDAVKKALGLADIDNSWDTFSDQMRQLVDTPINPNEAREFFSELLRPKKKETKPITDTRQSLNAVDFNGLLQAPAVFNEQKTKVTQSRAIRGLADIEQSYNFAPGAQPGTAYGVLQGVTHYIDHKRGQAGDSRLTSAWFGQGDTMKETAFERLLTL